MKRRNLMTGIVAVLAIGSLSFLIPSTGADLSASQQGSVRITIVIPQPEQEPVEQAPVVQEQPVEAQPAQPMVPLVDDPPVVASPSEEGGTETGTAEDAVVTTSDSSDSTEQKEVHEDSEVPEE